MATNRFVCDALKELRKITKIHFKKLKLDKKEFERDALYFSSLTEEIQTYVNRMEAALLDYKELGYQESHLRGLGREKRRLKKEIEELETKKEQLEKELGEE